LESDNEKPRALEEILTTFGARHIGGLLRNPEVKRALLEALSHLGCRPPANHLVFFCLDKAMLGVGSLLGKAATSRLDELLMRIPAVRTGNPQLDLERLLRFLAAVAMQAAPARAPPLPPCWSLLSTTALAPSSHFVPRLLGKHQ
jgi:hypothetical protein